MLKHRSLATDACEHLGLRHVDRGDGANGRLDVDVGSGYTNQMAHKTPRIACMLFVTPVLNWNPLWLLQNV